MSNEVVRLAQLESYLGELIYQLDKLNSDGKRIDDLSLIRLGEAVDKLLKARRGTLDA